jgi:hypothetical protein
MARAISIKNQILAVCEAISIAEIEKTYGWLSDILGASGFQISSLDAYEDSGLKLPEEETFTLIYRISSGHSSISREEIITLVCRPNSKPFMTASFSCSGNASSSEVSDYMSMFFGGTTWDTPEEVQNGISEWISEIKASSMYQDLLDRFEPNSDDEFEVDDQDVSEPVWY